MTRIEDKKNPVEELECEVESLKKKLKRKQSKKIFNCGSCFLLFIIFVLFLLGAVSYGLAKSGLKEIPVLTEKLYSEEPSPSLLVKGGDLAEQEKDIFANLAFKAGQESLKQQKTQDFSFDLEISQEQLTFLLNEQIRKSHKLAGKIDYVQLAVLPESLELFAKFAAPSKLIITLNFSPAVKEGKLDLKVINFKIGHLKLPNSLGNFAFSYLAGKGLQSALDLPVKYGQINDIRLIKGKVIFEIMINNLKDLI